MRGKLYLSAAFATLALCLSQGAAQTTPRDATPGANRPGASESIRTPEAAAKGQENKARQGQRAEEHSVDRAEKSARKGADEADKAGKAAERDEEKAGATAATKAERKAATKAERDASKAERKAATKADHDADKADARSRATDRTTDRATDDAKSDRRDQPGRLGERQQDRDAGRSITGQDTTQPGSDMRTGRDGSRTTPDMRTGQDTTRPGRDRGARQDTARGRDANRGETYGYAGGDAARLDRNQQNQLRNVLQNQRDVRSYSRNDVNVRVGAAIPPNVNFYPLPPQIASIVPQYAGYDFFRVEDQFVIVDPGTRQIVSVIGGPGGATYGYGYGDEGYDGSRPGYYGSGREAFREGGRDEGYRSAQRDEGYGRRGQRAQGEAYGYAAPRVRLDARQERALYQGVMREARSSLRQVCVRVGERVPESVDLDPVPRRIADEAPDARRFDYFILNDQVVLVDPDTRIVADIIEQPR